MNYPITSAGGASGPAVAPAAGSAMGGGMGGGGTGGGPAAAPAPISPFGGPGLDFQNHPRVVYIRDVARAVELVLGAPQRLSLPRSRATDKRRGDAFHRSLRHPGPCRQLLLRRARRQQSAGPARPRVPRHPLPARLRQRPLRQYPVPQRLGRARHRHPAHAASPCCSFSASGAGR